MTINDQMKQLIQKTIFTTFLLTASLYSFAQKPNIIQPNSTSINAELLNTGSFIWEQKVNNLFNTGNPQLPNRRFVTISKTAKEITIIERITENGKDVVKRKSVLNAKTFEPITAISETETFSYNLTFGSKIKGELENYINGEKEKFDVPIDEKFFLGSSLEILISILPLKEGYKAFSIARFRFIR